MTRKTNKLMALLLAVMLVMTTLPGMAVFASGGGQPNSGIALAAQPSDVGVTWDHSNGSSEQGPALLDHIDLTLLDDDTVRIDRFNYVQGSSPKELVIPHMFGVRKRAKRSLPLSRFRRSRMRLFRHVSFQNLNLHRTPTALSVNSKLLACALSRPTAFPR